MKNIRKRFQWRKKKAAGTTWEFAYFNVFAVGQQGCGLPPHIFDLDYNPHQEKLIKDAGSIVACCGDFGIKIFMKTFQDPPDLLFQKDHKGEKIQCVKWNHFLPKLLAYGSDEGKVRLVQMNENGEFDLVKTFTMDEKGEPAQVLSVSWDASARYLLASLSSDKVGVIHRKSKSRWSVLDPIVISDTHSVSSILISSAEHGSPFFVLAPSYTSTIELWARIREVLATGEAKIKWQKISSRDTRVVIKTMCAFVFQGRDLIATAGPNRSIDVWQILCEDRIESPTDASLVHIMSYTLSGSWKSYIEKMTWIRASLAVSCSDGVIYLLKVYRIPKKPQGELSSFICKEVCKLNQDCGYVTTCLKWDPKHLPNQQHLSTGGTHGFIYIWNLYTVPYLLAFEVRKRDWEINYYSISNAPAAEGDRGSGDDNTDKPDDDDGTDDNSIRQAVRNVLLAEYDSMEKSLSDAKNAWAEALNHLKDLLEEPNTTPSELKGPLGELDRVRKNLETAAGKAKFAYEGRGESQRRSIKEAVDKALGE